MAGRSEEKPVWTFITNHAQVLLYVAAHPEARVRDVAEAVGITERRTYGILRDLDDGGFIERRRVGREVHFKIRRSKRMRAPLVRNVPIQELLNLLEDTAPRSRGR